MKKSLITESDYKYHEELYGPLFRCKNCSGEIFGIQWKFCAHCGVEIEFNVNYMNLGKDNGQRQNTDSDQSD